MITIKFNADTQQLERLQNDIAAQPHCKGVTCKYGPVASVKIATPKKTCSTITLSFIPSDDGEIALNTDVKKSIGFFDGIECVYGRVFYMGV